MKTNLCFLAIKILIYILLSITILHISLCAYELSIIKPIGKFVTIGHFGQPVHISCTKPTSSNYTVIFNNPLGFDSFDWIETQRELERNGIHSCLYDRVGQGFSPIPLAGYHLNRSLATMEKEMKEVFESMEIGNKLIMVGKSLGGLYGLYFSNHNPNLVRGVVLIDYVSVITGKQEWFRNGLKMLKKASIALNLLGKLGYIRILNFLDKMPFFHFSKLPQDIQYTAFAMRSYGSFWDAMALEANVEVYEEMENDPTPVNQVPIRMLDAGMDSPWVKGIVEKFGDAHERDMKMFKDVTRVVVKDVTHETIQFRKKEIVDAIMEIIKE